MSNSATWFSLAVEVAPEATEAIEFALNELGALGIEINNLGPDAVRQPTLTVVGYFDSPPTSEAIENQLGFALSVYELPADVVKSHRSAEVVQQDWLAEWKKHWKPTITGKFVVAPTWEQVDEPEKFVIRIEPSMAFGTGTHETTRLCLKAIELRYDGREDFFDVGTGTGILAIAAQMIATANGHAPHIAGCDTDADSIVIANENKDLNNTPQLDFTVGSINSETPVYPFVCANLTADVILPILPLLLEKSSRLLILSGILATQETLVAEELRRLGASSFDVQYDGEWISITVEREATA